MQYWGYQKHPDHRESHFLRLSIFLSVFIAVAKAIRTRRNTETKTRQSFPFCLLSSALCLLLYRSSVSLGKSAQSKSLRAFPYNDLKGEFLSETQKCRPIGKTLVLSGLQPLRVPRVTEERYMTISIRSKPGSTGKQHG